MLYLCSFTAYSQSVFDYDTASNAQHIGFYFSPGINMNNLFMENKTGSGLAKGCGRLILDVAIGVSAPLLLSRDFKYGDTIISQTHIKDVGTSTYSVYVKKLYGSA